MIPYQRLPRCLKPLEFGDVITAQLHNFCDASEEGYGTVTYLLLQNEHLQMHSAFIMGKACVAPLKTVIIPRMELIAATMASRMDVLWKKELHMSLQESVFWTDSASVLKYINNESSRLKVFVANRVSDPEIISPRSVEEHGYSFKSSRCSIQRAQSGGISEGQTLVNRTAISLPT